MTMQKRNVELVVPLKCLSMFWRTLEKPLIKFELSLILTWTEKYVLTIQAKRDAVAAQGNNPAVGEINNPIFKITDTKLHVSVVTLPTENDNELLEQLKTGFKITIKRNKYRSEITTEAKLTI